MHGGIGYGFTGSALLTRTYAECQLAAAMLPLTRRGRSGDLEPHLFCSNNGLDNGVPLTLVGALTGRSLLRPSVRVP
jgi:hypothetical protein